MQEKLEALEKEKKGLEQKLIDIGMACATQTSQVMKLAADLADARKARNDATGEDRVSLQKPVEDLKVAQGEAKVEESRLKSEQINCTQAINSVKAKIDEANIAYSKIVEDTSTENDEQID